MQVSGALTGKACRVEAPDWGDVACYCDKLKGHDGTHHCSVCGDEWLGEHKIPACFCDECWHGE